MFERVFLTMLQRVIEALDFRRHFYYYFYFFIFLQSIILFRWPNTVFTRALANALQRLRKDCKNVDMASIQQSFYLLNASAVCTIFPHN